MRIQNSLPTSKDIYIFVCVFLLFLTNHLRALALVKFVLAIIINLALVLAREISQ